MCERDGRIEPIENGLAESRWVADRLGRPVIKAFNDIMAPHLLECGRPAGAPTGSRSRSPATTRPPKATVMQLVCATANSSAPNSP